MDIKKYVLNLLTQYCRMKKELAMLEYELKHLDLTSPEEMIEAMTYNTRASEDKISGGGISDSTPHIAMAYEGKFSSIREEAFSHTKERLSTLTVLINRLEYQVTQLEAYHAALIREHYFEGYLWTELAALKCVSKSALLKQKEAAISELCEMYKLLNRMKLIDISE